MAKPGRITKAEFLDRFCVPNYFVKRDESVKQLTSVAYIIAGVAALYFGVVLSRSAYNM